MNPIFKIISHPDFDSISPKAIVTYEAQANRKLSNAELAGIRFSWSCFNDPATVSASIPPILKGPNTQKWENARWAIPGRHTILLDITYADGRKVQLHHSQWVDTASNILKREFDPNANNAQPGPFQVLKNKETYHQVLLNIAKVTPPPTNKKEDHEKLVEQNKTYIGHFKHNLEGLEGLPGLAVDAWHMDRQRSQRTTLSLWLVKIPHQSRPTWRLVDWTNPAYKYTTGVYEGTGATDEAAIRDVISEWDSENRYPDGIIRYEFHIPRESYKLYGEFESDGESFWDEVSRWLDYAALGGAVIAGVVTLIAPVPGSRVVSAGIWTSIFTSTAAATINIAQRHDEGFGNWKDDAFDGLSIVGNIFAAGTVWKLGASITSATKLGSNMTRVFLIGQVSTDGLQGILLGSQHIGAYNQIKDDPTLSPDERLKKLMALISSAAIAGTLTYISIKGATGDINNLNNNRTLLGQADIGNPKTVIDLDTPVSSVPIAENQKHVDVIVETNPKNTAVLLDETPNAKAPKRWHLYEDGSYSQGLMARVKERADALIGSLSGKKLNPLAMTSRSGVDGKHFKDGKYIESDSFENLGKNHFDLKKDIPGAIRDLDNFTFIIAGKENIDIYIIYIKNLYKKSGNLMNPFTEGLIREHLRLNRTFDNTMGLPGLHAEVQSTNHLFNQLTAKGINLKAYDLSKIEVATYKIQKRPGQGNPYHACVNCSSILKPPINILTGR